jgi:hypothetical protein
LSLCPKLPECFDWNRNIDPYNSRGVFHQNCLKHFLFKAR